jgi:hypothetical protein
MANILVVIKTRDGVNMLCKLKFFIIFVAAATIVSGASADSKTYVSRAMDLYQCAALYSIVAFHPEILEQQLEYFDNTITAFHILGSATFMLGTGVSLNQQNGQTTHSKLLDFVEETYPSDPVSIQNNYILCDIWSSELKKLAGLKGIHDIDNLMRITRLANNMPTASTYSSGMDSEIREYFNQAFSVWKKS